MKKSKWTTSQINQLLEAAKNSNNRSQVFSQIAAQTGRKADSVRNFYYKLISDMEEHGKNIFVPFAETDVDNLLREIILGYSRGESIRSVCLKLGNNDKGAMLRFQNKYRVILAKEPSRIDKMVADLEGQGYLVKNPTQRSNPFANVITMPTAESALSDADINNLFMGLVRLIKRNSNDQVEKLRAEIERLKAAVISEQPQG